MLSMNYREATCQQLNQFYKQNRDKARAKPQDIMCAAINDDGKVCAVLRLLSYDTFLFLRSVLTANEYRGQGIASELTRYALKQHACITYTLPTPLAVSLYQRLGFTTVPKQEIPEQLSASYRRFRQGNDGARVMVINSGLG
mgnify:CR=1 FL=1